ATENWGGGSAFLQSEVQSQDVPWVATFRGRMGLDYESTLLYLTGGLAVGQVKNSYNGSCSLINPCNGSPAGVQFASFSEDKTRLGWTAGVGVEHMFSSHWTVRGEFRYVDLGRSTVGCASATAVGCGGVGTTYRGEFSSTLMNGLVGV